MATDSEQSKILNPLPVVLLAAIVQGWALYGLHHAIKTPHWPATQPEWLLALYAIAALLPLTVQLLAEHVRQRAMWLIAGTMALLFCYFGWHHGAHVMDRSAERFVESGEWFPLLFVLGVLWLLLLPFIQFRLSEGHWRARYQSLFATAWRNKLTLAEAALFTGLFWLLLFLWMELFRMLGISFFKELFEEPIFVYPVTSLTFGVALYLIGSLERLTSVVLQQILNVLKWLAIVAGLILALFTMALAFKLPAMVASGNRAISAAWLLWLVAVTVLLVNAAYRDGSVDRPYPKWLAFALRCVIPLTVVIGLTALYALYVRVSSYGFTVERVWACIVAAAACIYAAGYAYAATRKGPWMAGIERINIATALFLIVVISLALTPVLSPYRITANSQFGLAQAASAPQASESRYGAPNADTPFYALRFDAGSYGRQRLRELSQLQNHPRAAQIRAEATAMLARRSPWEPPLPIDAEKQLAALVIYPADRSIEPQLRERLLADLQDAELARHFVPDANVCGCGVFADLDADGVDEFVLILASNAYAYRSSEGAWRRVGTLSPSESLSNAKAIAELQAGNVQVVTPKWRELRIGSNTLRMNR